MGKSSNKTRTFTSWLLMLPTILLFAFFVWEPLIESVRLSLYKTSMTKLVEFVGLKNYIEVFKTPEFQAALGNTFMYTLWSLVIGFFIPIFMALIIGEVTRGRGLVRTASYFPNIMPGLASILMWKFFFTGGQTAIANDILSDIGIIKPEYDVGWLSGVSSNGTNTIWLAIPVIVVIMTWKGAGATALIYMAGLAGINPELYEAATIDGAGVFRRIAHITIPEIISLGSTMLILQIISIFQIFYEPMALRGSDTTTLTLMQEVYYYAFGGKASIQYDKAAAISVVISVILILFTLLYNRVNKKVNEMG